jgi:hypothetical protein
MGEPCLIVADIVYGMLDNGIIKGYVYSPANPQPLVQTLDHSVATESIPIRGELRRELLHSRLAVPSVLMDLGLRKLNLLVT